MTALSPYSYGPSYQPAYRNTYPHAVQVSVAAKNRNLVALSRVKTLLGIVDTSKDALLQIMIVEASGAIETFCSRVFALQQYTETIDVDMIQQIVLEMNPIAPNGLVSVTGYSGSPPVPLSPVTTLDQIDYDAAIITSDIGFTVGRNIAIYYGGWWLPDDDLTATDISAQASDKSFNSAAGAFPILYTGAPFKMSGFAHGANNGSFTVVTATASKVTVSNTLVDEAAGPSITCAVRNLPADLEMAAARLVMIDYENNPDASNIEAEEVPGVYRVNYAQPGSSKDPLNPLPAIVAARIRKYVRQV